MKRFSFAASLCRILRRIWRRLTHTSQFHTVCPSVRDCLLADYVNDAQNGQGSLCTNVNSPSCVLAHACTQACEQWCAARPLHWSNARHTLVHSLSDLPPFCDRVRRMSLSMAVKSTDLGKPQHTPASIERILDLHVGYCALGVNRTDALLCQNDALLELHLAIGNGGLLTQQVACSPS